MTKKKRESEQIATGTKKWTGGNQNSATKELSMFLLHHVAKQLLRALKYIISTDWVWTSVWNMAKHSI